MIPAKPSVLAALASPALGLMIVHEATKKTVCGEQVSSVGILAGLGFNLKNSKWRSRTGKLTYARIAVRAKQMA